MPDGTKRLTAYGLFMLGSNLTLLEWNLYGPEITHRVLIPHLQRIEELKEARYFERAGKWAESHLKRLEGTDINAQVPAGHISQMQLEVRELRGLISELAQDVLLVDQTGSLDPQRLLKGIDGFLKPDEVKFLSRRESSDLAEACNCVFVGSVVAAEQITLRVAESLLRRWHKHETKQDLPRGNWGQVFDDLEKAYPPGRQRPDELAFLGYLVLRRNEVGHPDGVSTANQAEATLMVVLSLVERLHRIIP